MKNSILYLSLFFILIYQNQLNGQCIYNLYDSQSSDVEREIVPEISSQDSIGLVAFLGSNFDSWPGGSSSGGTVVGFSNPVSTEDLLALRGFLCDNPPCLYGIEFTSNGSTNLNINPSVPQNIYDQLTSGDFGIFDGGTNNLSGNTHIEFDEVLTPQQEQAIIELLCPTAPIPTISQWGLFSLIILFLIFGIIVLKKRKVVLGFFMI